MRTVSICEAVLFLYSTFKKLLRTTKNEVVTIPTSPRANNAPITLTTTRLITFYANLQWHCKFT